MGTKMTAWSATNPTATLEERAEAFRVIPQAVALEVRGKREKRWKEG